jgi:hypothetical protein
VGISKSRKSRAEIPPIASKSRRTQRRRVVTAMLRAHSLNVRATAEGEPETFDSRRADGGVDSIYLGENDSSLKGDVWRGDNLGGLIAMKPKPVAS